jgi:DNA-binding beta-propeller fold protein YncE
VLANPGAVAPAFGEPYIQSTIDIRNQTLRPGSFVPGDGLFPYTPCYAPSVHLIYVANVGTNYVTIINSVNHSLVGYLPVATDGSSFCQVARGNIYFAGADLHLIQVFNTTTQQLEANIPIPGAGVLSFGYNPVLNWVYASVVTRPWSVTAISNTNFSLLRVNYVRNAPASTVVDTEDNEIFIGDDSDNVNVLNATTLAFVTNLTIGLSPQSGIWDPLNDRVFLGAQAPYNIDDFAEVDPVNNTVIAVLNMNGWPNYTAMSPSGQWIYWAMDPGDNVTMMNATNISQQYTFQIGTSPDGIAFDADTNEVVTANQATNNVSFINATTGRVDATVADGQVPSGMAFDPTTADLFIADSAGNAVNIWNSTQDRMVGSIPFSGGPTQTDYDSSTQGVFVLRTYAGLLSEINATTLSPEQNWSIPFGAPSFAVDPAVGEFFVADTSNFTVEVFRLSNGAHLASIEVIQPTVMQYCPTTGLVYAISGAADDALVAIDPTNESIVATGGIGLIGEGISCNPYNGDVYVTNQRTSNVTVLNGTTLAAVHSFPNGGGGSGVAYDDQNAELLAASDNPPLIQTALIPGNLTVVGTVNNSLVATIPAAVDPVAVAYDPDDNTFFVANYGSGTVSVVQPNTAPPEIARLSVNPSPVYTVTNTTVSLTATATSIYGIPCPPGVNYSWQVAPTSLGSVGGEGAASEEVTTSMTAGTGDVVVNATFDGAWAVSEDPLAVVGGVTVPLASAAIRPGTLTTVVGGVGTFVASATLVNGDAAPSTTLYRWTVTPISLGSLNTTEGGSVDFTASAVGSGSVSVSAYDAGSYAYATTTVTVLAAPLDVVARLVLLPVGPPLPSGGNLTLTAIAYDPSGANVSALAVYHWQLQAPAVGTLEVSTEYRALYLAGNRSGNDSLSVTAVLNGGSASANTSLQVLPPSPNGTSLPPAGQNPLDRVPAWAWVAIVAAAVVALVLFARRPPRTPRSADGVAPVLGDPTLPGIDTPPVDGPPGWTPPEQWIDGGR